MSLRTPSKIVSTLSQPPYIVRFVTHGESIKYSNIIKSLNNKPISTPTSRDRIYNEGFTDYDDLMNYPDINKGSMYQLIKSLPPSLVEEMKTRGNVIMSDVFMKEGVCLTMFVYKIR